MINTRLALLTLGAVALFCAGGYSGYTLANKKRQAEIIEQQHDHILAITEAREVERELQAQVDQIKRNSDAKISTLNRRVGSLVVQLRERPQRPAVMPSHPVTDSARCTGAGLYRDDAEFLVRLAADADTTREALNQCKAAYEAVQNANKDQ